MISTRTAVPLDNGFQTREEDGNLYVEGYFSVFGSKYWLWEDAYETIETGAFDLETDKDVRALVNHDTTLVLGRTTAGTLTLKADDKGLWGSILINPKDQDAVNLYERVKRGDVTQCSFGFDILEQDVEHAKGKPTVWRVKRVKLYEVTVATFPAYEDTSVEARKKDYEAIRERETTNWRHQMMGRLKGEQNGTESIDAEQTH